MSTFVSWRLKRYGWLVSGREGKRKATWTIIETKDDEPAIKVSIMESGYLLVVQGQQSLETISLLECTDSLKVRRQSDNLFFQLTVKGDARMMRMQFDGSSRAEAINECSDAVKKLKEFLPVTTRDDAPPHPNQPPAEPPAPTRQQTCQEEAAGPEPEVVRGSLSVKRLTQHYLGETALTLPRQYHPSPLMEGDMEPFLRVCLLDPSFNAFVEKVEVELRKLLEE